MKSVNRDLFVYIERMYSRSHVSDVVKTLYQAYVGPSHYRESEEGIILSLEKEKKDIKPLREDLFVEKIGPMYARVHLSQIIIKGFSMYTYVRLFLLSKEKASKGNKKLFIEALKDFREFILEGNTHIQLAEWDMYINDYESCDYHSLSSINSVSVKFLLNKHVLYLQLLLNHIYIYYLLRYILAMD